jgi:BirA family biotin operon repressor/biotin-[acetyl-CoA-carboxylase] ligase
MRDRLDKAVLEKLLNTAVIGRTIFVREEAASTNLLAKKLAREGCPEGTAVIARAQTGGRGRRGASWFSPPGGIWLSVILAPRLMGREMCWLTLMAAWAVRETIKENCGLPAEIKWPNDVLVGGRKICGILTETTGKGRAVVGIGLNDNIRREGFPPELRETATSLLIECGREWALAELAAALLSRLDRLYAPVRKGDLSALKAEFAAWPF